MRSRGPWMGPVSGGGPDRVGTRAARPTVPASAGGGGGRGGGHGLLLVLFLLLAQAVVAKPLQQNMEKSLDGCDRTIWSSLAEPRAVHQLSVRCAEGIISWQQAEGAVRVVFNAPAALKKGRQLETCFSISSHLIKVVVSVDGGSEGMQPLTMLSTDYPRTGKDLCMRTDKPVSLFLETQPGEQNLALGYVKIYYDVNTISKNDADSMEECRPCTDDELLLSVCSMDFVVSGKMNTVLHSSILEQTTIAVSVGKIYRQKSYHFTNSLEPSRLRRDVTRTSSSFPSTLAAVAEEAELESHRGMIVAPHKCGIRYGEGDFLFVGRMRLGRALLQCAPRLEEFEALWRQAEKAGQNPCTLD